MTVTAGTGAARRGDPAGGLARAGVPDEPRSGAVSDGDGLDALTSDLPAPRRPEALTAGASGDPSERRVRGDDGVRFTAGAAGGVAARPLPTIDSSLGEKPSSSVTPAILTRTVTKSPPSVFGSPTCSTVPIVPVGNCGPDTRTRGRRPAATSSRSWTTCSSASSVSRCAAMPLLSAQPATRAPARRDRRHVRPSRPCDIDADGVPTSPPTGWLSDSQAARILRRSTPTSVCEGQSRKCSSSPGSTRRSPPESFGPSLRSVHDGGRGHAPRGAARGRVAGEAVRWFLSLSL